MVLPRRDASQTSLSNVADLIEQTFAGYDHTTIDYRNMHAVLLVLARKLSILERQVKVNTLGVKNVKSPASTNEIKIHGKEQIKKDTTLPAGKGPKGKTGPEEEIRKEKLVVVNLPTGKDENLEKPRTEAKEYDEQFDRPRSIATMDDFLRVLRDIQALANRAGVTLPGSDQLNNLALTGSDQLNDLATEYNWSDPMPIAQLSARLEPTEKAIEKMSNVLKELVKKGPQVAAGKKGGSGTPGGPGGPGTLAGTGLPAGTGTPVEMGTVEDAGTLAEFGSGPRTPGRYSVAKDQGPLYLGKVPGTDIDPGLFIDDRDRVSSDGELSEKEEEDLTANVTFALLTLKLNKEQKSLVNCAKTPIETADKIADEAKQKSIEMVALLRREMKDIDEKVDDLQEKVEEYASKISYLDQEFSQMVTNYQDELTNMVQDLEIQLDEMNEALANRVSDTVGIADLNSRFSILQDDLEQTMEIQILLSRDEKDTKGKLQAIKELIEKLESIKMHRDEVEEALKTKAGVDELNGLLTTRQFDAFLGGLQKTLVSAYSKFNSKEYTWQRMIEERFNYLSEKAEKLQVDSFLNDAINKVGELNSRTNFMIEVCGELRKPVDLRALKRSGPCLCCYTPDIIDNPKPKKGKDSSNGSRDLKSSLEKISPALEETGSIDGDENFAVCYPTARVPHKLDPRASVCAHPCGGRPNEPKLPKDDDRHLYSSLTTTSLSSGKKPEETKETKDMPCIPCNRKKEKL